MSTEQRFGARFPWAVAALDIVLPIVRRKGVQRAAAILMFGVAVAGVIGLILANLDQLRTAPWRFDAPRFLAAMLLQASTIVIATFLWADMAHKLGASRDIRRDTRTFAFALLARRLPGAFWHVLGRAAYYGDVGLGKRVGVVGSLLEMGLLVVTGVAIGLVTFAELWPYSIPVGLACLVFGPPALRFTIMRLGRGDGAWMPSISRIYLWTAVDTAAWMLGATGIFLEFDALYPIDPSLWIRVLAATTISIVGSSALLIVPGGLGVRELGMTAVLAAGAQPIPAGVAAALSIAFRVSIATIEVLWALSVITLVPGRKLEVADGA